MNKYLLFFLVCLVGFGIVYKLAPLPLPQPQISQIMLSSEDLEGKPTFRYYRANSLSGNFLAARFAQNNSDWRSAGVFLDQVLRKDKDNIDIINKDMVLAIGSGLPEKGIGLAHKVIEAQKSSLGDESQTLTPDMITSAAIQNNVGNIAHMLLFADFAKKNDFENAKTQLEHINKGGIADFIKPILQSWADASKGKENITALTSNTIHIYHALLIKMYLGDKNDYEPFLQRALGADGLSVQDLERIGDIYAYLNNTGMALKIYEEALKNWPDNEDIAAKVETLKNPDENAQATLFTNEASTPQEGIAIGFYDIAQLLFRENSDDSARVFVNLAKYLNPGFYKADLLLGYIYARQKMPESALTHYQAIPESDVSNYRKAQGLIADLYEDQGDIEKAVETLKTYHAKTQHIDSLIQIGDIYRRADLFMDAVLYYDKAEAQILKDTSTDTLDASYWHLLYARGMALERAGKWERAEKDLQAALNARPNDAMILNYLGYAWADQGENLEKAYGMIEQAAALEPEDGYIVDSLGWVLYRMGKYPEAVEALERAIQLMPYDSTINDHLGDAYWQHGRRIEARFQWERALNNLDDSNLNTVAGEYDTLKKSLEDKLENGLHLSSPDMFKKVE